MEFNSYYWLFFNKYILNEILSFDLYFMVYFDFLLYHDLLYILKEKKIIILEDLNFALMPYNQR